MKKYNAVAVRDYYPTEESPFLSPFVHHQVKGLGDLGIESCVISPTRYVPSFLTLGISKYFPKSSMDIVPYDGVDVIRPSFLKIPYGSFKGFNLRAYTRAVMRASKKIESNLIHAHFGHMGLASLKLKEKWNCPLITSFYGYDAGLNSGLDKIYKPLFSNGDLFLVLSEHMKQALIQMGAPSEKIVIHHLGVDTNYYVPNEPIRENKLFTFLFVARLDEGKGIQDSIDAFARFNKTKPETQLFIVGSGAYKKPLESQIVDLGCEDKIKIIDNFSSPDPRGQILNYMQDCDISLFTSVRKPGQEDGTPVVLMEAQSCEKPCIVTDNYGLAEVVLDNQTGFVEEVGDISGIVERMVELMDNRDLRFRFGKEARKHVVSEFNIDKQNETLASIFNKFL